ncbi:MAG: STAS domain-containing protein [Deferribacteraceae bacterium]|jgi:anti-sigma B factor antagonist|nr:STAS domain-containing protein [Deferribacteraceae bacterium]
MSDKELSIVEDKTNSGIIKFFLKGRITSVSANSFQYKLEEANKNGYIRFVINMQDVEFLSSVGIRILLMFYKKANSCGGSFNVENPSENVINVLGLTSLDKMLL